MDITRFSSSSKLAKFCGIAPTEKKAVEGKKSIRNQNTAISLFTLLSILWLLPHISRTRNGRDKNPISRAYYLKKISEGKTKKEAITCLARRLVDLIYAVMRTGAYIIFQRADLQSNRAVS